MCKELPERAVPSTSYAFASRLSRVHRVEVTRHRKTCDPDRRACQVTRRRGVADKRLASSTGQNSYTTEAPSHRRILRSRKPARPSHGRPFRLLSNTSASSELIRIGLSGAALYKLLIGSLCFLYVFRRTLLESLWLTPFEALLIRPLPVRPRRLIPIYFFPRGTPVSCRAQRRVALHICVRRTLW